MSSPAAMIVFSTVTGNAYKLACAAAEGLREYIGPYNIRYITPEHIAEYDTFILCYWCNRGTADDDTISLIRRLQGKRLILVGSLGVPITSPHARQVMERVAALGSENNLLLGQYLCQGAIDLKRTAKKLLLPEGQRGHMTQERFERQKLSQGHPDSEELLACTQAVRRLLEPRHAE